MTVDGFECDTALDMKKEEKDLMLVLVWSWTWMWFYLWYEQGGRRWYCWVKNRRFNWMWNCSWQFERGRRCRWLLWSEVVLECDAALDMLKEKEDVDACMCCDKNLIVTAWMRKRMLMLACGMNVKILLTSWRRKKTLIIAGGLMMDLILTPLLTCWKSKVMMLVRYLKMNLNGGGQDGRSQLWAGDGSEDVAAWEASGVQKEQRRVRSNRGMGTLTLMLFIVLQEAEECI